MKILKTQLSLSSNETESIKAQLLTLGPLEQSVFLDIETTADAVQIFFNRRRAFLGFPQGCFIWWYHALL